MEKLVCTSCGAPIDPKTGTCPYCGSRYLIELNRPDPIVIQVENPRVQRIAARCNIPMEMSDVLTAEEMRDIAMRNLTNSIAECIAGYADFKTDNDFRSRSIGIEASVRIVPPHFKF